MGDAGELPTQALQGLQQWLPVSDLKAARLVCRHWAAELGAAVSTVALPPALWQGCIPPAPAKTSSPATEEVAASLLGSAGSDPDLSTAAVRLGPPKLTRQASVPVPRSYANANRAAASRQRGATSAAGDDDDRFLRELEERERAEAEAARRAFERERDHQRRLAQLVAAFPAARAARLTADPARLIDPTAAAEAARWLAALRGLGSLAVTRLWGDAAWDTALGALLAPQPGPAPLSSAAAAAAAAARPRPSPFLLGTIGEEPASPCLGAANTNTASLARRLSNLRLLEVDFPGPAGFAVLARAARGPAVATPTSPSAAAAFPALAPAPAPPLAALRRLEISATGPSRLLQEHITDLGSLTGLTRLRLAFRAAAGGGGRGDLLCLDALCSATGLEELELSYTGFEELGSRVGFSSAAPLAALPRLRRLVLRRLASALSDASPLESAPALRELEITGKGPDPILGDLLSTLGRLSQLRALKIEPVAAGHLGPALRGLTALEQLSVGVADRPAQPPAAAPAPVAMGAPQPPQAAEGGAIAAAAAAAAVATDRAAALAAGAAVAHAFAPLRALRCLRLAGPLALRSRDASAIASACPVLQELRLTASLPDGTLGFSRFGEELKLLTLALPAAALARRETIRVLPLELPPALKTLEGEGLRFERVPAATGAGCSLGGAPPGPTPFAPPPLACGATLRRLAVRAGGGGGYGARSARPSTAGGAPHRAESLGGGMPPPAVRDSSFGGSFSVAPGLSGGSFGGAGVGDALSPLPDLWTLPALRDLELWQRRPDPGLLEEIAAAGRDRLTRISLHLGACAVPSRRGAGTGGGAALLNGGDSDSDDDENGDGADGHGAGGAHGGPGVRRLVGRLVRQVSGSLVSLSTSLSGMLLPTQSGNLTASLGGGLVSAASFVAEHLARDASAGGLAPYAPHHDFGGPSGLPSSSAAAMAGAAALSRASAAAAGAAPHGRDLGPFSRAQASPFAAAAAAAAASSAPPAPPQAPPAPPRGLAALGQLEVLEVLELELDDPLILGPSPDAERARRTLRALPALHTFSLALHTDRRASGLDALGRDLAVWLAPTPARWQELRIRVAGPAAAGGGQRIVAHRLADALPRCKFG